MNSFSKLAAVGMFGLTAAVGATPAQAALVCSLGTCTATVIMSPATTEISAATVNMPLFDSNVGTLTGKTISFTATEYVLSGSFLTNNAGSPQSFLVSQNITFILSGPGSLGSAMLALSLIPTTGFQSFTSVPGGGGTAPFGPFTQTDTENLVATLGLLQAPGGGNYAISLSTITGTTFSGGGGNIASSFSTQAGLQIDVEYTYTTGVPEPMSIALFGVGLAGLGYVSRKRNRKAA
jgi:hypothetical protein